MSSPSTADFGSYQFVRDAGGSVVSLPVGGGDERVHLVLDRERWGCARLHRFPRRIGREDRLDAFSEAMTIVSRIRCEDITRVFSWGCEGEELFFVSEIRDGEPLGHYLERTGSVPVPLASRWILRWLDLRESMAVFPPSWLPFSIEDFEVVCDRRGALQLVLSPFWQGAIRSGSSDNRDVHDLARVYQRLLDGNSSPPDNEEGRVESAATLRALLQEGSELTFEAGREVALPQMPIRDWMRMELENAPGRESEHVLSETPAVEADPYAILTRVRGIATRLQILPLLPRDGWLDQHHEVTRRPGRGRHRQMQVNYLEDCGSLTLIGEEQIEGVTLAEIVHQLGSLPLDQAREMALQIDAAIDFLEQITGSSAVRWLPPENVFWVTGTRSLADSLAQVRHDEAETWRVFPLKLRLHQTFRSLIDGVDLPARLRGCLQLSNSSRAAALRSAVGLPLLWNLRSGKRFSWEEAAQSSLLSSAEVAHFEKWRRQLRDHPEEVTENFFQAFSSFEPGVDMIPESPESSSTEKLVEFREGIEEGGGQPFPRPLGDSLPEILNEGIAEEKVARAPIRKRSDNQDRRYPPISSRSMGWSFWLWVIFAGGIAAAVTGYQLFDWTRSQGLYAEVRKPEFSLPRFRSEIHPEIVQADLANWLLNEGSPGSLRLLTTHKQIESEPQRRKTEDWLRRFADTGDIGAARLLGNIAHALEDPAATMVTGYGDAARKGDFESGYHLAVLDWDPERGTFTDGDSREHLEQAAERGHAAACELLSHVCLAEGNAEEAFQWMSRSAEEGHLPAIYQLGIFYASGLGCPPNAELASVQFQVAAGLGETRAMFDFGRCLGAGFGVARSSSEATRWVRLAAARGHRPALHWLRLRPALP